MSIIDKFKDFAPQDEKALKDGVNTVIYTRVSHSSQEDNTSLESQKRYCENFANKRGLNIVGYFGGKVESAKTDDRKEFNRMLQFVKRSKNITYLVVYSYERFSRSGINGAQIADELLKKYGVVTLAVTQELDPTTPAGSFQQKILFLFSQMDNELRRDKAVTGMKEVMRKGYMPGNIPRGYINLNKGKAVNQKVVLSEQGKLMRKAFHWKANTQMTNAEIVRRLNALGVHINERILSKVFKNPFYCGIIVNRLIPGEVIQGKHEPMVSQDLFIQVNDIIDNKRSHPVSHKEEDEELPLKRFLKCDCGTPMTGYLVKKKGLYYYKCRVKGCKNNKSAKKLHKQFETMLSSFSIEEWQIDIIKDGLKSIYSDLFQEQFETNKRFKAQISEAKTKIESIEEKYVLGDIPEELFKKYKAKYKGEIEDLEKMIGNTSVGSSNLEKCLDFISQTLSNPLKMWGMSKIDLKMRLQNLMFPDGIVYDRENDRVRTFRINALFAPIPEITRVLRGQKKGEIINFDNFSYMVGDVGFEPTTPCL
ncbi:recombinase family protein [Parvicella tangerina]|uniref:recombinase family protein n=1 Tax=Parvicella tangerina TaxID=2829795 RepID=UPI00215C92A2|nr:recombinase family protein [Parvicella tangerina]